MKPARILFALCVIGLLLSACGKKKKEISPSPSSPVKIKPLPTPSREEVIARGGTEVHLAVYDGDLEKIRSFERKKQFERDNRDNTALHLAVLLPDTRFLKELVELWKGGPVFPNQDGLTPLELALATGNVENAKVLLKKSPYTLSWILSEGKLETLKKCLRMDKEIISRTDHEGETLLHRAARKENEEIVSLLIERGSDPQARNREGETPLHLAAQHSRNPRIAAVLLEAGADINALDNSGNSALHEGSFNITGGGPEMIAYLCARGIEVDRRRGDEKDGFTALHFAVLHSNYDNLKALIRQGADPLLTTGGETALHLAVRSRGVQSKIHAEKILAALLSRKIDVNAQDPRGDTPLHIAARRNRFQLAWNLLLKGASPKVQNELGETPVEVAHERIFPLFERAEKELSR